MKNIGKDQIFSSLISVYTALVGLCQGLCESVTKTSEKILAGNIRR
jgi:hypothetical protein